MKTRAKLVVINKTGTGNRTEVLLDDKDISAALSRLTVTFDVRDLVTAELELPAVEISRLEVEHPVLFINEPSKELLEYFGWTPPPEDFKPGDQNPNPWDEIDVVDQDTIDDAAVDEKSSKVQDK